MLIITRKIGETIQIGDDITVMVVDVMRSKRCRIVITAPPGVEIIRHDAKIREPKRSHEPRQTNTGEIK